ncbi:MAG: EAL domain-containing protein [Lachnospiraceae bacterium]
MKQDKKTRAGSRLMVLGIAAAALGGLALLLTLVRQIGITETVKEESGTRIFESSLADAEYGKTYSDPSVRASVGSSGTRRVLFLASYDPTAVNYEDEINGMLSESDASDIEFDIVNMDFFKHHTEQDYEFFYRHVKNLLAEEPYCGVIVADDEALGFVMDNREELFSSLPIVFYGVEGEQVAEKAADCANITGYLEDTNVSGTLDLALTLFPDTKEVLAICDGSKSGQAEGEAFLNLENDPTYADLSFSILRSNHYSPSQIREKVENLPDDAIILLLTCHSDRAGNYYTSAEMTKLVSESTSAPVFRNSKGGYNNGAVAGESSSFQEVAAEAVRVMQKVLDEGLDLSTVSLQNEPGEPETIASYSALKRFGISTRKLPQGTILVGAPVTIMSQYGGILPPVILIIGGFLLITVGSQLEVRRRRRAEEALRRSAEKLRIAGEHDVLTGALTRQEALSRLREDAASKRPYALVLSDMDGFKEINETYGHGEGDRLLKEIAGELSPIAARYGGQLARYGGDEFLIWIVGYQITEGDPLLQDINRVFQTVRTSGMNRGRILASVGAANAESSESAEDVILCAEAAVARVKCGGKNGCLLFTKKMRQEELEAEHARSKVLSAIQREAFYMVYQPQVDTRTGKLVGFESLVRMQDGAMGPDIFIPIAEKNGWIRTIGRMTTEMTIRQIREWRDQGLNPPPVSINYSAGQLGDTEYESCLQDLLAKYQVPSSAVHLEITESLFIQNWEEASAFFERIRGLHISLLMDDFGTGYSSLSYLARIPVDVVKIDRSLLTTYGTGKGESFLRDIIGLIHDVGKTALCEGVETNDQYGLLEELGCDRIQGYYFGRPGSAKEAAAAMARGDLFPEQVQKGAE